MKDLVLVESQTAREQLVDNVSVLDKIKALPYLTSDMRVTVKQVAHYYEVNTRTIQRILEHHKAELASDGIQVVSKKTLKQLGVNDIDVVDLKYVPTITLLPKRAVLRIGMLLADSEVAKSVRNYLLNLEEISTQEQKEWSLEREMSKLRRRVMTDAIRDYVEESPNKRWKYKHFTELVYQKAFGQNTKDLKLCRRAGDNDSLRDTFTANELTLIEKAEVFVAGLIMAGFSYAEIKAKIKGFTLIVG